MNMLMKTKVNIIGFALLAATGIVATPTVHVNNETKGRVKFSVDVKTGDGKHDMWLDPKGGANDGKSYDVEGRSTLVAVKIRYYPADGSPMLSFDHDDIPVGQDGVGLTWAYWVRPHYLEYRRSYDKNARGSGPESFVADDKTFTEYWKINLQNQSPYIAIAAWGANGDTDFAVIEPNTEKKINVKDGTEIKLFEKEGNPVTGKKDDLNAKTLEISGSEDTGFSLIGSGSSTGSDSGRTYKNNTPNWVTYDYKEGKNDWRILRGSNAQGHSEADKNVKVRFYTKEKQSLTIPSDSEATSWIIDTGGELKEAK